MTVAPRPAAGPAWTGGLMHASDVDLVFRREAGRVLATLIRLVGDFDLAEEAAQEAFAIALGLGIEKIVAQMTVDQKGAIAVFEGMGFRPEALLRDQVKDREGRKHDLLILAHEVAKFQAQMDAYGVTKALED